jgi:hypothetical protein
MYQHRDLLKGCVLKFLMDTFLLLIFRTWNSSNGLDTFLFPENSVDLSVCTYHPDGFVRICAVTMSIDLYPQFSLDLFVDHMNHCLHFSNCCIIFSSFHPAPYLCTLFFSSQLINHNLVGVWLWRCCSLSMEQAMEQIGDGGRERGLLHRIGFPV